MQNEIDTPMIIRSYKANSFLRTNTSFNEKVGFSFDELSAKPFVDWIISEDQAVLLDMLDGKIEDCLIRHKTSDGQGIVLNVCISNEREDDRIILARFATKVAHPRSSDIVVEAANIKDTLHEIACIIEEQNPEFKCSILLVEDGHFVKGAGPSLSSDYNDAIDGFAIGPAVGSCGTAIYWNIPVIVCDIPNDPLWIPFADLARQAGVAACWSHPFTSKSGNVLGALAFYSSAPRIPTLSELNKLKGLAQLTGLSVERGRAEVALLKKHNEMIELEAQFRQAAKMEALGVMAGGISHDFNNVLATILANAEIGQLMLAMFPDNENKENLDSKLNNIISAGQRAGNFCNQMLSYAGHGQLAKKRVKIKSLVSELDSLVLAALSKKTTLEFSFDDEEAYINADENQLLQVLMNLITNAGQAIHDKQGKINVSSKLENYDEKTLKSFSPDQELHAGPYICLKISDNGSGMTEETKSKIYDPFYTTKKTGHGLGLSAVKGIIKKHQGIIYFESKLDEGTTFTILLPVDQEQDNSEIIKVENNPIVKVTTNKSILIVDDEVDLRLILAEAFDLYGYEVVLAVDGQEAVDIFTDNPSKFDCILMDFSMPKLDGHEAATKIHSINQDMPIILMSGYNEDELNDLFDDAILYCRLKKPVRIPLILEMVKNAISKN
jgi:signal transduction histidine kinase